MEVPPDRVFGHGPVPILDKINEKMSNTITDFTQYKYVGILDMSRPLPARSGRPAFGFENFNENSLEQLCINYTVQGPVQGGLWGQRGARGGLQQQRL